MLDDDTLFFSFLTLGAKTRANAHIIEHYDANDNNYFFYKALYFYRFFEPHQALKNLELYQGEQHNNYYMLKAVIHKQLGQAHEKNYAMSCIKDAASSTLPAWLYIDENQADIVIDTILFNAINTAHQNNDVEQELFFVNEALKLEPDHPILLQYLLYILYDYGKYEQAYIIIESLYHALKHDNIASAIMLSICRHNNPNDPIINDITDNLWQQSPMRVACAIDALLCYGSYSYNYINALIAIDNIKPPAPRVVAEKTVLGLLASDTTEVLFYNYYMYILPVDGYYIYMDSQRDDAYTGRDKNDLYRNIGNITSKTLQTIMRNDGITHLCLAHHNPIDIDDAIAPIYLYRNPYIDSMSVSYIVNPSLPLSTTYSSFVDDIWCNNFAASMNAALIIDANMVTENFIAVLNELVLIISKSRLTMYASVFLDNHKKDLLHKLDVHDNITIISLAVGESQLYSNISNTHNMLILWENQLWSYKLIQPVVNGAMIVPLLDAHTHPHHPLTIIYQRMQMPQLLCADLVALGEMLAACQDGTHYHALYQHYYQQLHADTHHDVIDARRAEFRQEWGLV